MATEAGANSEHLMHYHLREAKEREPVASD